MSNPSKLMRRDFLSATAKASLALAMPTIIPATAIGLDGSTPPSERINLGVIGIGRRCRYVLAEVLKLSDVRCRMIADVQAARRDEGKKIVDAAYGSSDCETVRDFRELLARKEIDAVLIATGDRWHAPAAMLAAEAGKDVYCEKPCGLTIDYCQRLDATIRTTGRVFQAGTQRRSVTNYQQAVRMVHDGKLGRVTKMIAAAYAPSLGNTWLPAEPTPARESVDWNMWLGPAPWRPYNRKYVEGEWRGQWDFDSGARLLDWGVHTLDLCQMANKSDHTLPVEYSPKEKGIVCRYADGLVTELEFLEDPFGNRPGWISSTGTCPVRFIGERGWVETGDGGEIHSVIDGKSSVIEKAGDRSRGFDVVNHVRNFFDCMRSRKPTAANSTVMRRSHIACHAAALAWVLQRQLKIDPQTESFVDDEEANSLKSRPSRNQWMS
ncbi:MAG: Gfo/Idh/MocA family protein [Planctomycetaceae bacterium]